MSRRVEKRWECALWRVRSNLELILKRVVTHGKHGEQHRARAMRQRVRSAKVWQQLREHEHVSGLNVHAVEPLTRIQKWIHAAHGRSVRELLLHIDVLQVRRQEQRHSGRLHTVAAEQEHSRRGGGDWTVHLIPVDRLLTLTRGGHQQFGRMASVRARVRSKRKSLFLPNASGEQRPLSEHLLSGRKKRKVNLSDVARDDGSSSRVAIAVEPRRVGCKRTSVDAVSDENGDGNAKVFANVSANE